MLRFDANRSVRFCDGLTRRDFLHAGAIAPLGLTLPHLFAQKAAGAAAKDKDVNCIMLFLVGGPSQIDTWDPKPKAPAEIRGPFSPIATAAPGMQISEIFPKMAKHADKFSLVRSVYHTATAVHDTGHQMMQTGRLFTGGIEHPHAGCVLTYLKGQRGEVPGHVLVPRPIGRTGGNLPHGQTAGYLGKQHDPFVLNADPSDPKFKVPDLLPPDYISSIRADRRQKLRDAVDGAVTSFEKSPQAKQLDENFALAYKLMSSKEAREALALDQEPAALRDRYGRTRFGQSCLLARRLIERGVRFVTVNMFETVFDEITWDIHGSKPFTDIAEMAKLVAPNFDNAYSSLLQDLKDRGMLESTVIIAVGEFGRTPKVNPAGGRDHHPGVWTIVLGGGPIKGGRVIGESDELGYIPKSRPVTPPEVAATLYHALGLDPHKELPGPQNRPMPLADFSVQPIKELFYVVRSTAKRWNFWDRLKEIDMFFEGRSKEHQTLRRLVKNLEKAGIDYAIVGGMAVNAHNHQRTTGDVDVLISFGGFQEFRRRFVPKYYQGIRGRLRRVVDPKTDVNIDILVTGLFPGSGKPGPIAYPDPSKVSESIHKIRFVDLSTLVELKLAAGRPKDVADVVDLIRANDLDESFEDQLDPFVRPDYREYLETRRREDMYEARHDAELERLDREAKAKKKKYP